MGSYNKVNGSYACEHRELLRGVLKGEWGFDGAVISDWFAVQDGPACARGGLDLEMPGPPRHWGPKLAEAVRRGEVPEADLDEAVRAHAAPRAAHRRLRDAGAPEPPERAEDRPEHRASPAAPRPSRSCCCATRATRSPSRAAARPIRRLAVIGPNARHTGGPGRRQRARDAPLRGVDPRRRAAPRGGGGRRGRARAPAAPATSACPSRTRAWLRAAVGRRARGLTARVLERPRAEGAPACARAACAASSSAWFGAFAAGVEPATFCARLTGRFTPPESGRWTPSRCACAGRARLSLDGARRRRRLGRLSSAATPSSAWAAPRSSASTRARGRAAATTLAGRLRARRGAARRRAPRGRAAAGAARTRSRAAVALARSCDAARRRRRDATPTGRPRASTGRTSRCRAARPSSWRAVAAANPRTIVALNTGSPARHAVARRACRPCSRSGSAARKPATPSPTCCSATPTRAAGCRPPSRGASRTRRPSSSYPGEHGHVLYGEGVFAGTAPTTRAASSRSSPSATGSPTRASPTASRAVALDEQAARTAGCVASASASRSPTSARRAGQEVVQLYVADLEASVARPPQELRAFAKLDARAGRAPHASSSRSAPTPSPSGTPRARAWVAEAGDVRAAPRELLARPPRRARASSSLTPTSPARSESSGTRSTDQGRLQGSPSHPAAPAAGASPPRSGCGELEGPGEIEGKAPRPAAEIAARARSRAAAVNPEAAKQILFGDLHVHTTFSADAFMMSLPLMQGEGPQPDRRRLRLRALLLGARLLEHHRPRRGPDAAHAGRRRRRPIRQCNAVAGDPHEPGHRHVPRLGVDADRPDARGPLRPQERDPARHRRGRACRAPDPLGQLRGAGDAPARRRSASSVQLPLRDWSNRQRYFNFGAANRELRDDAALRDGVDTRELPDDCSEGARDARAAVREARPVGLRRRW